MADKFKLGNKMSEEKKNRFLGAKVTKKVKFMGQDLDITKLSISQVMQIQEQVKTLEDSKSEEDNLRLLATVVKFGASDLVDLSQEEINSFAMDELTNLSTEIMKFSGLGNVATK